MVGMSLFKFSYFHLVLSSWKRALEYYIKYVDRYHQAACYANLSAAYLNLGDSNNAFDSAEKLVGYFLHR